MILSCAFKIFMHVAALPECVSVHPMCAQYLLKQEEGIRSPRTEASMWVLAIEPWYSGRVVSITNY